MIDILFCIIFTKNGYGFHSLSRVRVLLLACRLPLNTKKKKADSTDPFEREREGGRGSWKTNAEFFSQAVAAAGGLRDPIFFLCSYHSQPHQAK